MSDFLSQEEIESLLKKSEAVNAADSEDMASDGELSANEKKSLENLCMQSMKRVSQALTGTLEGAAQFKLESMEVVPFSDVLEKHQTDKIGFSAGFHEGFTGNMMLLVPKRDAARLARKVLGEQSGGNEEMSDKEMNTVFEVLNLVAEQTAMELMESFQLKIVIKAPEIGLLTEELIKGCGMEVSDAAVEVKYTLSVAGLFIACEFIQVFPLSTGKGLASLKVSKEMPKEVAAEEKSVTKPMESQEESVFAGIQPPPIITQPIQPMQAVQEPVQPTFMPQMANSMNQDASQMPNQGFGEATMGMEYQPESFKGGNGRVAPVQKPQFSQFSQPVKPNGPRNIDMILDVPLEMSVVLGRAQRTVKQILSLEPGSIVELNKYAEEPLDIYVNGKLIGQGEVVVVEEKFGIRVNSVISTKDRTDFLR